MWLAGQGPWFAAVRTGAIAETHVESSSVEVESAVLSDK